MKLLRCPVCNREVSVAFADGDPAAALQARQLFISHAERQHGVGELDGLLFFAEAVRRRRSAA